MYLRVRQSVFDAVILSDLKQKPENFTPKVGVDFEQRFAGVLAGLMDTELALVKWIYSCMSRKVRGSSSKAIAQKLKI